jgi:hypothetical protein
MARQSFLGLRATSCSIRPAIGPVIAYYGTYTVDESASTLTYNVESSTSPAFDGAVRKQQVVLSGDMLTTTGSPVKTSDGEIVPTNEWKRVK